MRIVRKHIVKGLPKGQVVEYFGKIDDMTYFVIFRPEESRHLLDYTLVMGEANGLFWVPIDAIEKYHNGALKSVKTVRGEFQFSYHRRMQRIGATFNDKDIEIL